MDYEFFFHSNWIFGLLQHRLPLLRTEQEMLKKKILENIVELPKQRGLESPEVVVISIGFKFKK